MKCVQSLAPSLACSQNWAPSSIQQILAKRAMKSGLPSVPLLGAQGTKERSQIPRAPLDNPPSRRDEDALRLLPPRVRSGRRGERGAMRSRSGHMTLSASVTLVHLLRQSGRVTFKPVFSPPPSHLCWPLSHQGTVSKVQDPEGYVFKCYDLRAGKERKEGSGEKRIQDRKPCLSPVL